MTATDELRRLLDDRGVEWEAFDDFEQTTQWSTCNGAFVYWARELDGKLLVETTAPTKCSASCTPEQAVKVTVGRGTCKNTAPSYLDFLCSECGFVNYRNDENFMDGGNDWHYCPNCGRKVMDE